MTALNIANGIAGGFLGWAVMHVTLEYNRWIGITMLAALTLICFQVGQ